MNLTKNKLFRLFYLRILQEIIKYRLFPLSVLSGIFVLRKLAAEKAHSDRRLTNIFRYFLRAQLNSNSAIFNTRFEAIHLVFSLAVKCHSKYSSLHLLLPRTRVKSDVYLWLLKRRCTKLKRETFFYRFTVTGSKISPIWLTEIILSFSHELKNL